MLPLLMTGRATSPTQLSQTAPTAPVCRCCRFPETDATATELPPKASLQLISADLGTSALIHAVAALTNKRR